MFRQAGIQKRLVLVLWGSVLLAFAMAGAVLTIYHNLTLEDRALRIMQPYAQLVAVGTDSAVAFQDPKRAQEILATLKSNPHILHAGIFLDDGRFLAGFSLQPETPHQTPPNRQAGVFIEQKRAVLLHNLPHDALLRISMDLDLLHEQTRQIKWVFGIGAFILFAVSLVQLVFLRRMIVRPIATLTEATEYVRVEADYEHRVPAVGNNEVARLGHSFNAMLEAIQEKQELLLEAQQIAHIGNWRHDLLTGETYWSDEVYRIFGQEPGHDSKVVDFSWVHPDDRRSLLEAMEAPRLSKGEYSKEFRVIRPDGELRWVHNSWVRLFDEYNRETERVGTFQDITERKLAEESLRRLNRELRAISECNQILVRAEDEQSLLDSICRIVCQDAGYHMAWVGFSEQDEERTLRPVAWAGHEEGYLEMARFTWADEPHGQGPSGRAIRSGRIQCIDDFSSDPSVEIWREAALQRGYRSSIALPLKENEHALGVLCIYADTPAAFPEEEQRLLDDLANDLAFGIVALRTRDQRNQAEEQIRIAATAFEAQEGIVITDAAQTILRVNRAFTEITGFTSNEVVGTTPRLYRSDHHDDSFFEAMWDVIIREGAWQGEVWNRRKSGENFPAWLNITAVKSPQGEVTHYVGTMTDITERKEAEKKIEHLAFYDLLTDLPNRQLLLDRLHHAMMGSSRSHRMGALLFIDLDNFKILNDTCGHDIGDQLLVEVANRLTGCVREGDTISRLGGDEFIVILEDLNRNPSEAAAQAKAGAEKIIATLNQPYLLAGRDHHSTPSIGATLFNGSDNSVDELLKQADIAMYQAKTAGRNTLRFFDPDMQADLAARAEIEAALRLGIQRGEFVLHYQAQTDSEQQIIAVEALLRWNHPQRGMVSPAEFIPLAEETGLILPIGEWVLESACRQLAAWSGHARNSRLNLAVNVSALQFRQQNFVEQVKQTLSSSGAPANHLKLELTESVVLDDIEDSNIKMRALKAIGVGFALDDFGTGYSSLSYLTRLPLDQLKIDRSFILNLPDNPNDAVVVQTIITLASSLGLSTIAEGVETETQRAFLEQHGCPVFQGYLFSKPLDLIAFERLLAKCRPTLNTTSTES
jgi:diguanylate cyclase (GGDEF)-like protein/PAS domain S-box-containing protein